VVASLPERGPTPGDVDPDALRPPAGPADALAATPAVPVGGVRRTTSIAISWPDGYGARIVGDVRGRDVRAAAGGALEFVAEAEAAVEVDAASGSVTRVDIQYGPSLDELVGSNIRRGFPRALATAWPEGASDRAVLYSVLEDLNGAFFVAGYAPLREGKIVWPEGQGQALAAAQEDVCSGWARGGMLVDALRITGASPVPFGPVAPPMTAGADRWHDLDPIVRTTIRRLRRLDLRPAEEADELLVTAHFRDSYIGPARAAESGETIGPESVLHEYLVDARFGASDLVVRAITVEARVLPWDSCPGAVGSAQQIVGASAGDLPSRVRADFVGPSTCTHLNSTIRSLADVQVLHRLLVAGEACG
jgi:hypothetical protein